MIRFSKCSTTPFKKPQPSSLFSSSKILTLWTPHHLTGSTSPRYVCQLLSYRLSCLAHYLHFELHRHHTTNCRYGSDRRDSGAISETFESQRWLLSIVPSYYVELGTDSPAIKQGAGLHECLYNVIK